MGRFTIELSERISSVFPILSLRLKTLQDKRFLDEVAMVDNSSFVVYRHSNHPSTVQKGLDTATTSILAEVITETIINDIEPILVKGYCKSSSFCIDKEDLETLFKDAMNMLHSTNEPFQQMYDEKRNHILTSVCDYITTNDGLELLGFIRFRLKDYCMMLQDAVDRVMDDYLSRQEHEEFVFLLRNFVDIQEPQMDEVNVVLKEPGMFKLIDNQQNVIDNNYLEGFISGILDKAVDYDDLLVSALIAIAPRSIILHCNARYSAVDTIEDIFGHRTRICNGCSLCSNFKQMVPET